MKEIEYVKLALAQQALKNLKTSNDNGQSSIDARFLVQTSNICVRIFFSAGYALGARRDRLLSRHFEKQMFSTLIQASGAFQTLIRS